MRPNDSVIVAMDGRNRDPEAIGRAYNDRNGITRLFALNTLHNLNNLFGENIVDVSLFDYDPYYNEVGVLQHQIWLYCLTINFYRLRGVMKHTSSVNRI